MNPFALLAVVPLTDDQLLLNHAIQLVVLIVGLMAAFKFISASTQIENATQGLMKRFNLDKGLDKMRGGLASTAKKRAAFTGANMSQKLQDPERFGGRPARVIGRASNWNRNRLAAGKTRELSLEARKAAREEDVVSRTAEGIRSTNPSSLARAAVAVGGERVTAYAADKARQQFNESMKREEATMTSMDVNDLKKALTDALGKNSERAYAAAGLLVAKGKPGATDAGQIMRTYVNKLPVGSEESKDAAGIIRSHGAQLNEVSPDLPKWADNPGAVSLASVASDSTTYTKASSQKMATWSPDTIDRAHRAAYSAGGNEWDTMRKQAGDMVKSRYFEDLSPENKARYNAISTGGVPPPIPTGPVPPPPPPTP